MSFALMVCVGYVLGISSLVLAWQDGGELNLLIYVFSWNLLITMFDAVLVVRYSRPSPFSSAKTSTLASPPVELIEPARD